MTAPSLYFFPFSTRFILGQPHGCISIKKEIKKKRKKKERSTEIYAAYFFFPTVRFLFICLNYFCFSETFHFFSPFSSSLSLRLAESGTAGRTLPHSPAHAPRSFPWERTQGISDRLISLSGFIFNFFFFPLSFPWAWRGDSEFTLGVGRVTGFAIINLLFSQPPGMNDFEICKPDCQHLQRRKQPESREKDLLVLD